MSRLVDDARFGDFAESLSHWEACVLHFYADHVGLVTLGIGHLFDERNHPISQGMDLSYGRRFATSASTRYRFSPSGTPDAVYEDWLRVKRHVILINPQLNKKGREYEGIAQLRIPRAQAIEGATNKVRTLSNPIYAAHPLLERFDSRVAMAIVDVRFNPAGNNPLNAGFDNIWRALNDAITAPPRTTTCSEAAQRAYDLFRRLYAHRPVWTEEHPHGLRERYFRRHHQRTQRFREGLEATCGVVISRVAADEAWHY
jgi:hypothetical protein